MHACLDSCKRLDCNTLGLSLAYIHTHVHECIHPYTCRHCWIFAYNIHTFVACYNIHTFVACALVYAHTYIHTYTACAARSYHTMRRCRHVCFTRWKYKRLQTRLLNRVCKPLLTRTKLWEVCVYIYIYINLMLLYKKKSSFFSLEGIMWLLKKVYFYANI